MGSNPISATNLSQSVGIWPVGQAVKTRPFHGCNMGSIPVRVTKKGNRYIKYLFFFFCARPSIDPYSKCSAFWIGFVVYDSPFRVGTSKGETSSRTGHLKTRASCFAQIGFAFLTKAVVSSLAKGSAEIVRIANLPIKYGLRVTFQGEAEPLVYIQAHATVPFHRKFIFWHLII